MKIYARKKEEASYNSSSGTLDRLYCAFILGSTATAIDMETYLHFTFWGLKLLVKGGLEKAGLFQNIRSFER